MLLFGSVRRAAHNGCLLCAVANLLLFEVSRVARIHTRHRKQSRGAKYTYARTATLQFMCRCQRQYLCAHVRVSGAFSLCTPKIKRIKAAAAHGARYCAFSFASCVHRYTHGESEWVAERLLCFGAHLSLWTWRFYCVLFLSLSAELQALTILVWSFIYLILVTTQCITRWFS
jgi:hypothetical protein